MPHFTELDATIVTTLDNNRNGTIVKIDDSIMQETLSKCMTPDIQTHQNKRYLIGGDEPESELLTEKENHTQMRSISPFAERTVETVMADDAAEHMIVKADIMGGISTSTVSSLLSAEHDRVMPCLVSGNTGTSGIVSLTRQPEPEESSASLLINQPLKETKMTQEPKFIVEHEVDTSDIEARSIQMLTNNIDNDEEHFFEVNKLGSEGEED